MWLMTVIEEGTKSGYKYQYFFQDRNFKEGLTQFGERLLSAFPEYLELLIKKYPEAAKVVEANGGLAKMLQK